MFERYSTEHKKLERLATAYTENHADLIGQFPVAMQNLLPQFGFGQAETKHGYQAYEHHHGESLSQGQHPKFAVMSPSHFLGHRKNIIGPETQENAIGRGLALRVPGGVILNAEDELNYEAALFVALVGMKKLKTLFHVKSTASEILEFAFKYHKHHRDWSALPEEIRNDEGIREFVKKRVHAFKAVKDMGVDHFENMLVFDYSDPEANKIKRDEILGKLSPDVRYMRAMTMYMLMDGRERIADHPNHPKNTVAVLQGYHAKREFVWSEKTNQFVVIPEREETDPGFAEEKKAFLNLLPSALTQQDGPNAAIADLLVLGAREFKRSVKHSENAAKASFTLDAFIASCSDARAPSVAILGPRADWLRYVLRLPGSFMSFNGNLLSAAKRFFALATLKNKPVILTYHGNCGAMDAINARLAENADLPGPFTALAQEQRLLYAAVWNKGEHTPNTDPETIKKTTAPDEIMDFYTAHTGVRIDPKQGGTIADCMAVQQALWDYDVTRKAYPNCQIYVVYQNMPETQNYLFNPRIRKFVKIPEAEGLYPAPKAPNNPQAKHNRACGCGR